MLHRFRHLLSPGRIGRLELRNRVVMTPMGSSLGDGDGICGERIRAYYEERAKGGVGLQIMGSVGIGWPVSGVIPRQAAISDDRHIPGIAALAEGVHRHGGRLALQLHFGGLMSMMDIAAGRPLWTPSIPKPKHGDMMDAVFDDELAALAAPHGDGAPPIQFKVMSSGDIAELVAMFAAAADRAQRAGVDGVEIHAGHGYILSAFLSPFTNRRTDEYGGSIENRSRLLTETIRGIRASVGPDYPVWCRIDSQEFLHDGGISLADAIKTAVLAQEAGADAIHASAYADAAQGIAHSSAHTPQEPGLLVPNAAAVRAAVRIPVIAVGRIEPEQADDCIGRQQFDFVAMGRKLLADPHLAAKLADGQRDKVRPCIYCYTCNSQLYIGNSVRCAVNPETGFERELTPVRAARPKRVVVVGGGPAGMEAARRLSLKGHEVLLLERGDSLGGTLRLAAIMYEPNERILRWLRREIGESRVDVRLKTNADVALIRSLKPDEVIVANGADRRSPDIPGAERAFGLDRLSWAAGTPALSRAAARAWMPFGKRVVVIGGELVGLELAEFLAERRRHVTVIEEAPKLGRGLALVRRWRVLHGLREHGVALVTGAREIEIHDGEVRYRNEGGQIRSVATENVLIARGAQADLGLAHALREVGFSVRPVGDCNGVGYIDGAMRAAAEAAAAI